MPIAKIYKGQTLLETREFQGGFFINSARNRLLWQYGTEGWHSDEKFDEPFENLSTQWATWLTKTSPEDPYYFEFIRPDWSLKVNGKSCERGLYITPAVIWREVELIYRDYIFSFLFRSGETRIDDDVPLPKPDVPASAITDVDKVFPLHLDKK